MSKTFVEVAESVGVDEKTIRNVFKDYVALKEREYQFETPKVAWDRRDTYLSVDLGLY